MNIKLVKINQIKCNFCRNWVEGSKFSNKTLNSCDNCILRYREKENQVRTQNGQRYKMVLLKEEEHQGMSIHRLIEHFQQIKLSGIQEQEKMSTACSIKEDELLNHLHEKLQTQNSENNIDLTQSNGKTDDQTLSLNRTKSQNGFLSELLKEEGTPSQSYIHNRNQNEHLSNGFFNDRRYNGRFSDICQNLAKTKFVQRYKFYYDNDAIKKYQHKNSKLQKPFGSELKDIPQEYLHQNIKIHKKNKMFTCTSTTSFDSVPKSQKLSEEEVKYRIDSYLNQRYQSSTLHRLMATYVKQAYLRTKLQGKMLELISFNITTMDLTCFLNLFDFDQINTIKLIKVGLTDQQLHVLVETIKRKPVERLVLSCNRLTENSLGIFLNRSFTYLKEIYLGKNRIHKSGMKQNIIQLRRRFILYI